MKKILAFILIISIVGVLASCGKEEATTEPKPKTCEQIEPCKTALQYATYYEQGAADKAFKMELDDDDGRSYEDITDAKENIAGDYKQYQHKRIKKYGLLEYELSPQKEYLYKFRFKDMRNNENKNFTVRLEKQGKRYLVDQYYGGASKNDVTVGGEVVNHKTYYSAELTQQEKTELTPLPIEE
ncbi:hypothetical protein P4639_28555 [Priestia megaterium]|uniref:hypothetical protein n=1 Tax=Priestia megaterium TaxID=1404 RepID=UPI002E239671|nr:hypothetical protein [Priestia megaterium]